jgi:hypothetical protein
MVPGTGNDTTRQGAPNMSIAFRKILVCLIAVLALGAVASASASAAPMCYKVAVAGSGAWENNACTVAGGTKEYVKVEKLETQLNAGTSGAPAEWCAKVKTGEPSRFSDNKCTVAKTGTGEFIKVLTFKRIYEVCQEVTGEGTEPPTKFDNHLCNTKEKALALRKWEWKPIAVGTKFAVEDKGGAFKLEGGGKSSDCTAVTSTGEIGAGGESTGLTLKFTGCTNDPGTCEAFSKGKAGTKEIEATGLTDQLVERETSTGVTVLADEFKENATTKEFVTIEFKEGANACPNYPATKVKGQVAGECKNTTAAGQGETELVFPNPALTANSLEAFGVSSKLFGTATVSLVNKWSYRCA